MVCWNIIGAVALEKFVRLKSILSLLNFEEYISTEEVFEVPDPPTSSTAFRQKTLG